MASKQRLIPAERIERTILLIRGHKVMLDSELAALYGVTTKRLNEQVRRNRSRFPEDFMFQLTKPETVPLRSQFATLKPGRGQHRKYLPYVFTELEQKYDAQFRVVFDAIRQLMAPPREPKSGRIGFHQPQSE